MRRRIYTLIFIMVVFSGDLTRIDHEKNVAVIAREEVRVDLASLEN